MLGQTPCVLNIYRCSRLRLHDLPSLHLYGASRSTASAILNLILARARYAPKLRQVLRLASARVPVLSGTRSASPLPSYCLFVNIWSVPAPRERGGIPSYPKTESVPHGEDCWAKTTKDGKPGISVRDHCLNVGCVTEMLLSLVPSHLEPLVPHGAVTLAALHDLGKMSPGFQVKCEAWLLSQALQGRANKEGLCIRGSDHAKIGQFTIQELLHDAKLNRWACGWRIPRAP